MNFWAWMKGEQADENLYYFKYLWTYKRADYLNIPYAAKGEEGRNRIAEMTKISQPGISRLENSRYTPSSPLVVVLAKALKISTDELLGMDERRAS